MTDKLSHIKKHPLYTLLWGTAIVIVVSMTLIEKYAFPIAERQLMKPGADPAVLTNQTINELLLSATDLNALGKRSFINLYLKPSNIFEKLAPPTQPTSIYNKIFEKKVDIIKKKRDNTDFAIKPIPQ